MSLKLIQTLDDHQERVWCVAWNPKGTLLASCGGDKSIKIWGCEGDRWVCKSTLTDQHQRTIRYVSWSPCGNLLAAASFDSTISIWDRRNGEFESVATLEGHENEVKCVAWSISGSYLATCSRDKSVWVWACEEDDYECASVLSKHSQDVKKITWHPHVDMLASCSYDDTINVYTEDDDDWVSYDTLTGHTSTVWSVDFDKSGDRLVSCSADCTLKIWQYYRPHNAEGIVTSSDNEGTWKCVCTLSGYHTRDVYDVHWNQQTGHIVTAGGDNKICVLHENVTATADPKNEPRFDVIASVEQAHNQDVNCVRWNPVHSNTFASCSDDMNINIWRFCDEL